MLVDSSKSLLDLEELYSDLPSLGLSESNVLVLLCAKDPRGFVASMEKKEGKQFSLLAAYERLIIGLVSIVAFLVFYGVLP